MILMAEGRLESEWDRTALIAAKIHNSNARAQDQVKDTRVFNPLRAGQIEKSALTLKEMRRALGQ